MTFGRGRVGALEAEGSSRRTGLSDDPIVPGWTTSRTAPRPPDAPRADSPSVPSGARRHRSLVLGSHGDPRPALRDRPRRARRARRSSSRTPAYPDAYYYANVARALAEGRASSDRLHLELRRGRRRPPGQGVLPIPSNAHWQPLAAIVQVPLLWLLGPSTTAAALPFWLAAAARGVAHVAIGRDAGMPSWQAACAGLSWRCPGGLAPYLGQPDNFALFMLLGASRCGSARAGLRGDRRSFAVGGLVVGLAFLARTDGVLLGVPFALTFGGCRPAAAPPASRIGWWRRWSASSASSRRGPWLWRQLDVFGSLSPSAVGGRILCHHRVRAALQRQHRDDARVVPAQGPGRSRGAAGAGSGAPSSSSHSLPLLFVLVPFLLVGICGSLARSGLPAVAHLCGRALRLHALVSAVHVPSGRSSIPRSRSSRTRTSWRSSGSP